MERKNLNQVSIQVRNSYNRIARSSASVGLEEAIDLLKDYVGFNPEVGPARDRLRELEKRYTAEASPFKKMLAQITSSFKVAAIKGKMLKDPVAAMAMCEACLAKNLDNPVILNALADAANAAGAPFIAAEALTINHEYHPANEPAARKLIDALQQNGQATKALDILKNIAAAHPGDMNLQSELRSAMALASLERTQESAEEKAEAKERAKRKKDDVGDKSAQAIQQLIDGTIHDAAQAQILIDKFTEELEKTDSIDMRRKLSEAYIVAEQYDKAVVEMKRVAEMIGALDPTLDKSIEKATLAMHQQAIDRIKADPDSVPDAEEEIRKIEQQIADFKLERAEERVQLYPNDALLHFDLAELYFGRGRFDEALREYQQAMRSPQKRLQSLLRLGCCFARKHQYDIAIEQFETAMKDLPRGGEQRMEALYFLGNTYEESGNMEKAMECYKDIYQAQANYRDVAQRIDAYYTSKKNNG